MSVKKKRCGFLSGSRLHFILTCVWIGLLVPTVLLWRGSLLWLALISIYANIATHWGAYASGKAKEAAEGKRDGKEEEATD